MKSDAISLRRFSWLLDQRGYSYVPDDQLERVITVRGTRPDFYVNTHGGVQFLAEVKSFERPAALELDESPNVVMFVGDDQRRINAGPVEKAARQLAPYSNDGIPLVVVLDNHRQIALGLGTVELVQIFGSLQYEFTMDPSSGRVMTEGWAHSSKDYALGDRRRPHVSAVVVNLADTRFDDDDFSVARPMRVHAIHNPDATNPLPLWVFGQEKDKQIIRQDNRWIEFEGPPIIGTAWTNGSGSYGIRIGREDRDRHFNRAWGNVTLLVAGRASITVNIDKDSFWSGTCLELIDAGVRQWMFDRALAPWKARRPPRVFLFPVLDGRFLLRES